MAHLNCCLADAADSEIRLLKLQQQIYELILKIGNFNGKAVHISCSNAEEDQQLTTAADASPITQLTRAIRYSHCWANMPHIDDARYSCIMRSAIFR